MYQKHTQHGTLEAMLRECPTTDHFVDVMGIDSFNEFQFLFISRDKLEMYGDTMKYSNLATPSC